MKQRVELLRSLLSTVADPTRRAPMSAYMRGQFAFFGVATPLRRRQTRDFIDAALAELAPTALVNLAEQLWQQPERECQYVALDLLTAAAARLDGAHMPQLETLVQQKSWWDTVDGLASWVIGNMVQRERQLQARMDELSRHPDLWLRRVALLHQLRWNAATDAERLFRYCRDNAADPDFFIRKAIGWALRQYAHTAPRAVQDFVQHTTLAPLSRREALKHLTKENA